MTHTHNEEKISNNLFDLQFHIVKKKITVLQNLKNVVANKYIWTRTLYFFNLRSFVREPHTQNSQERDIIQL